ncbi:MAG: PAS domain S-box protein [bacterium]
MRRSKPPSRGRRSTRFRASGAVVVDSNDEEERALRSVALQNSHAIAAGRQRIERELAEERERLRITLASIGDAVISTDVDGRVVFLNGVAEALTGWPQAEAAGHPLAEVFQIVNEITRSPVEDPALRALREGRIVELANHTILIARDGTERPIDDSAAPMRDQSGETIGAVLVFRDVTERRRNQATQAQLAAIVESSEDAILSKTLDGVIRSWNAGAESLFGYTRDEAVGRNVTLLIPADRLEEERTILERIRRGERVEHFDTVRRRKDGRYVEISLTVSPIKNDEGEIIGASKIARDITRRTQLDAALRESEGRHRFLAELALAVESLIEPGDIIATSARMLAEHLAVDRCAYAAVEDAAIFAIAGDYSRGVPSLVGRWPVAAFGAECMRCMLANAPYVVDDAAVDRRAGADLLAYRQSGIQAVLCVPLHRAGKFTAAMLVQQKAPRRWTAAEIELVRTVVGRCWESLERARVGRGLKEAAQRLALALGAAQLGDWSWQAETDLVTLSPRAAEIFAVVPGAHMTWTALQGGLHPEDRERARLAVERAVATREPYDIEYRVMRHGVEEVWISAKGRAEYAADGQALGMLGVVQDITEKKRLEQELQLHAVELAEADRKKDDFIALLAHELRNPLAPVLTGLQVMRLAGDANAAAKARAMMERQLSHMVRLIDDLLDVSRISRNKLHLNKSRVLLAEVVSHALEATMTAVEAAGHQLHVSLPSEPLALDADLTRLAQVFGNILTNSAKYTEPGGQIWLTGHVDGPEAVIAIRDTGIGIPADALPRVFDMFAQVDRTLERATGGLGIGLALVRVLVESHGGTVIAESPGSGAGSTITVRLPIAADQPVSSDPTAGSDIRSLRAGKRVLVVDDNRDAAASMAELLELLGNEVHVAHDGVQAVETAERVRPDLVLMDVGMPRLDGLSATRQLRERPWGRGMTIIALTGWGQDGDRQRTRDAGCNGHLVKPVSLTELERLLAALADSREVADPSA